MIKLWEWSHKAYWIIATYTSTHIYIHLDINILTSKAMYTDRTNVNIGDKCITVIQYLCDLNMNIYYRITWRWKMETKQDLNNNVYYSNTHYLPWDHLDNQTKNETKERKQNDKTKKKNKGWTIFSLKFTCSIKRLTHLLHIFSNFNVSFEIFSHTSI